jgi:hypothetical protein
MCFNIIEIANLSFSQEILFLRRITDWLPLEYEIEK